MFVPNPGRPRNRSGGRGGWETTRAGVDGGAWRASAYLLRGGAAAARVGFIRHVRPTTLARVLERGFSVRFLHRTWSQKSTTGSSVDVPTRPSRQSRARGGFQRNRAMTKTVKSSGKKLFGANDLILHSNVSGVLPDEDVEVEVTEHASSKGTKRKRASKTKGPCEHGVKYPSNCKVCSACPHGKKRSRCKECGGASICEHGRQRHLCKECGGASLCEHGRQRSRCKECGGSEICEHGRVRSACKECGGSQICEHGRQRSRCKECGGGGICEHGRLRYYCKECGGSQICEHGRQRYWCKECGGSQICEHGRERSKCKECGGSGICEHGRLRSQCKECGGSQSANTVVSALHCKECGGSSVPVGRWVL